VVVVEDFDPGLLVWCGLESELSLGEFSHSEVGVMHDRRDTYSLQVKVSLRALHSGIYHVLLPTLLRDWRRFHQQESTRERAVGWLHQQPIPYG
jgi:hypothetical protein